MVLGRQAIGFRQLFRGYVKLREGTAPQILTDFLGIPQPSNRFHNSLKNKQTNTLPAKDTWKVAFYSAVQACIFVG